MKTKPPLLPWSSVDDLVDEADINAIRALNAGKANEGQQIRAIKLIVNVIAGTYDMSFRPGVEGARATDFAEGKRHVGNQIVRLTKLVVKPKGGGAPA